MTTRATGSSLNFRADRVETLQLNITRACNQACVHCHVSASPRRREMMPDDALDACIAAVERSPEIECVDITGGAPELHPRFRELVVRLRELGRRVMIRHNLTVAVDPHPLTGEPMTWVPEFFAEQRVELVCSLPCYDEATTDQQRGSGVFARSIEALRRLNGLGYGVAGSGLKLDLVYNPDGPALPRPQLDLERDYRLHLEAECGVVFGHLLTITNMPLGRFGSALATAGSAETYRDLVHGACDDTLAQYAMCRALVSVGIDGQLYDCDFNQAAALPLLTAEPSVFAFDAKALSGRQIRWAQHCEVCLAGDGSGCGGALRAEGASGCA